MYDPSRTGHDLTVDSACAPEYERAARNGDRTCRLVYRGGKQHREAHAYVDHKIRSELGNAEHGLRNQVQGSPRSWSADEHVME